MTRNSTHASASYVAILMAALLLILTPAANAGTSDDPEIVDATLDAGAANAWADVERAWVEQTDSDTLRFHMQLAFAPETRPGTVYAFLFDLNGTTHYAALVHVEERMFGTGTFKREALEESGFELGTGTFTPGVQALVSVDLPLSRIDANATTLTNLEVIAVEIAPGLVGGPYVMLDAAPGQRDFTLKREAPEEDASPSSAAQEQPPASGDAGSSPQESVQPAASGSADNEPASTRNAPLPSAGTLIGALSALALVMGRARHR